MPPTVVTSLTVVVGASGGGGVAHAASSKLKRLRSKGSIFVFMEVTLAFIRQLNAEMRPAAVSRHQLNIAVMRQYILTHDRQTDAVAMTCALRLIQALIERIEDPVCWGPPPPPPLQKQNGAARALPPPTPKPFPPPLGKKTPPGPKGVGPE